MKILFEEEEYTGNAVEILSEIKQLAWDQEKYTLEEYLKYMCKNFYKMHGKTIDISNRKFRE